MSFIGLKLYGNSVQVRGEKRKITPYATTILWQLMTHETRKMSDLIDAIYRDDIIGPLNPAGIVQTSIYRLRQALRGSEWRIRNLSKNGGWTLERGEN